jgi:hypothetical protein
MLADVIRRHLACLRDCQCVPCGRQRGADGEEGGVSAEDERAGRKAGKAAERALKRHQAELDKQERARKR